MSASYPNTLKTFSSVVDGVTKLVASLFNSPYDEVTAIETMLGVMGCNQSFTESFKNVLYNYKQGCLVAYNSSSNITVAAGEISIPDGSGNLRFRRNTSPLTVDFTMLDTGSVASNTTYYVYIVADASATTFLCKLSTSSSAPSGFTFYRQIGSLLTDGSNNILQANVVSIGAVVGYGASVSKSFGTNYQAATDGIVEGYCTNVNGGPQTVGAGYTDSSTSPSTLKGYFQGSGGVTIGDCMSFTVKKGDYYRIDLSNPGGSSAMYFRPSGS